MGLRRVARNTGMAKVVSSMEASPSNASRLSKSGSDFLHKKSTYSATDQKDSEPSASAAADNLIVHYLYLEILLSQLT